MASAIQSWKNAWRTTWYYIYFSVLMNFFSIPIYIGRLDLINNNTIAKIIFYVIMLLFYLPFAVQWASKISGLHPLTEKEAKEKEEREREEYKQLNRKMNNIEQDN